MEQLIFVAIIVIFSILDSVARTKKKRQGGGPLPGPEPPQEWETEEDSYQEAEPLPQYSRPYGSPTGAEEQAPKGSEGMIPSDLWEEIAGLARGRVPQQPPAPEPAPSRPAPPRRAPPRPAPTRPAPRTEATPARPVPRTESVPARPVETHSVHRAHEGFGTDPSSRVRSREDGLDPLAFELGLDASAARHQLLSRDRHALRQAVILQEILGPPAALRSDPFDDKER
jgi:hypothetical protein